MRHILKGDLSPFKYTNHRCFMHNYLNNDKRICLQDSPLIQIVMNAIHFAECEVDVVGFCVLLKAALRYILYI